MLQMYCIYPVDQQDRAVAPDMQNLFNHLHHLRWQSQGPKGPARCAVPQLCEVYLLIMSCTGYGQRLSTDIAGFEFCNLILVMHKLALALPTCLWLSNIELNQMPLAMTQGDAQ